MQDHQPEPRMGEPRLSVVIPMYNEEERIGASLERILAYLEKQGYAWEILPVDDGSTDGTREVVRRIAARQPSRRIRLVVEEHRGKGHAVRSGMLKARGESILFTDADLSTPIEEVERFLAGVEQGYDIVIGSREAPGARRHEEPLRRHLVGRVFNYLVRALTVKGFHDTQCGFKLFSRRAARALFPRQTVDRFSFDVEILYLAQKSGLRILELPVQWYYGPSSTMRVGRDGLRMGLDVLRVRYLAWRGAYGRR